MVKNAKRILSLAVVMVMLLSVFCIDFASAVGETYKLSKKAITRIEAYEYTRASESVRKEGSQLSYQGGHWVEFDIMAPEAKEYEVLMTVGSTMDGSLEVRVNDEPAMYPGFKSTGGLSNFKDYLIAKVTFKQGLNTIRITNLSGSYYFRAVSFAPVGGEGEANVSEKTGPFKKSELPTIIEAENFDLGTSKSIDSKNDGREYRTDEGIDIYKYSSGGYYITLNEDEFVNYSFNVQADSAYTMFAKGVADEVNIYFDNSDVPFNTKIAVEEGKTETELISVFLKEGEHTVKIAAPKKVVELDNIRFASAKGDYINIEDIADLNDDESEIPSYLIDEPEVKNPVYKNLYVAENGSDSNDGSKERPFKSIKRAKEETAKLSADMTGDIVVNIAPGYYQLEETEVFNETHSGKNGFNIIYKGSDRFSAPIISGGKKVESWEKVSDVLWKAPLETESSVRNLYINGYPAVRARSKYEYRISELYDIVETIGPDDGFKVSATNFPVDLVGKKNVEVVANKEFVSKRLPVDEIFLEDDKVVFSMKQPYWAARNNTIKCGAGSLVYFENAFCLLDEPGEFYYNDEEGYIYYYPYNEENMETADSYIAEVEFLAKIEGSGLDSKVENITFDNLDFRYGAWEEVSEKGLVGVQAEYLQKMDGRSTVLPAQIQVNKAKNIDFKNSFFSCLGSGAINMNDAVSDSSITGNLFKDISGAGIMIGLDSHAKVSEGMEMCENITIKNNVFERIACEYYGSVGVFVLYEKDIYIVHNTFKDCPYTEVSAGWGWGETDSPNCGNIIIAYNRFEDAMTTLRDGAHLYTLGANPGSTINNNYFLRQGPDAYGGVYNDSGSAYFKIYDNVFESTPRMWFVGMYKTHDMSCTNNYADALINPDTRGITSHTFENNTIIENGEWPEEALMIKEEAGVEPKYKNLVHLAKLPKWRRGATEIIPKGVYSFREGWIEAEDFMVGGQDVGYHKNTDTLNNNQYRPDGVHLKKDNDNIGYMIHECFDGEWTKYEIEIEKEGKYDLHLLASHAYADNSMTGMNVYIDDELILKKAEVQKTAGWETITDMKIGELYLTPGSHTIKLEYVQNGFFFDAFKLIHEDDVVESDPNAAFVTDPHFDEGKIVYQHELKMDDKTENEEVIVEEKILFGDISGHWAEENIKKMTKLGMINGYSDEIFAPDDNVTLYQAIWLSMRVMSLNYDENSWQEKALEYGLIAEIPNSDTTITREEFIDIIMKAYKARYGKYSLTYSENAFGDMDEIKESYVIPVLGAKHLEIIHGDENGNFNPKKLLSRAEAVTVLSNVLN